MYGARRATDSAETARSRQKDYAPRPSWVSIRGKVSVKAT